MRVLWDLEDLWGGRKIKIPGTTATGSYIVSYIQSVDKAAITWCLVCEADGMILQFGTREKLAEHLNGLTNYLPAEILSRT